MAADCSRFVKEPTLITPMEEQLKASLSPSLAPKSQQTSLTLPQQAASDTTARDPTPDRSENEQRS